MPQAIRYVVLDFDGTCTQVERVHDDFLKAYLEELQAANPSIDLSQVWPGAIQRLRDSSPKAGWTLDGAPSTAPAAADPYILSGEAATLLQQDNDKIKIPDTAYKNAYARATAPWRIETSEVLEELVARKLKVGFISNSRPEAINLRLTDLLATKPELRAQIKVRGNAKKYQIRELPFPRGLTKEHIAAFERAPAINAEATAEIGRPVYLRRGSYFESLCSLWEAFGETGYPIAETIFCGDIWELDLALPQALGAHVHLIHRSPKEYGTYAYETARLDPAHHSDDLRGLLARL